MKNSTMQLYKLSLTAMFIAIGFVLPFLTGQIPSIGSMLLPMHIPAFIAGFVLGPFYGLVVGFMMPITRALIFGMPPLYPVALIMAFELATYGFISGLLFKLFFNKHKVHMISIISVLVIAMLIGRGVWGLASYILLSINGTFTFTAFLSGAFITAWPGIVLQLIIIPVIIYALYKAQLIKKL